MAAVGFGATINVNTPNDEYGTVLNQCSLREAVQTANDNADFGGCTHTGNFATGPNSDLINLPAANPGYALARTGAEEDNNVQGDLDIRSNITIQGAGAGTTPIFVCAGCADRIVEVVSGTNVDINDVTLKFGHPAGDGAGLFNGASASTTLTRVTIGLNDTVGKGGGIYNEGTLVVNASAIVNNQVTGSEGGGGGIYNADGATLTLNDSRVLDNTATRDATGGAQFGGGGIRSDGGATLALNNSTVDGNVATTQGATLKAFTDGGGILVNGDFTLTQSTVSNNTNSGNDADGGGIACFGDTSVGLIERTLISGNTAATNPDVLQDSPSGGGIFCAAAQLTIVDSLIRDNTSESGSGGGGLLLDDGSTRIVNTTISANHAVGELLGGGQGGGIQAGQFVASLEIVNSTLSGNTAGGPGGGLFVQTLGSLQGEVRASLSNVTVAGNTADVSGGGVFVSDAGDGEVVIRNSVLSGNVAAGIGDHDDCDGPLTSDGNNLVKNPSGCVITGVTAGNQLSVDAKLGALLANGGALVGADNPSSTPESLPTRQPANDSPLLDAGFSSGCEDQAGFALLSDQRGEPRPVDGPDANATVTCDIGAVEVQSVANAVFADGFE